LEARLRAVVPAVRLLRERYIRRVLRRLEDAGEPVTLDPDRPVWIGRDRLRELDVVPEAVLDGPGDPLLLLTEPRERFPVARSAPDVLRAYWRLLFRAAILAELRKQAEAGRLTDAVVRERFAALGPAAELEARFVLETDHVVPYGADALTLYSAFAAVYADYARFEPANLQWVFPAVADAAAGLRVIARDVAVERLFDETRPAGAAEAAPPTEEPDEEDEDGTEPSDENESQLLARARRAAELGNHVRAAILRTRAGASGWSALRNGLVKRLAAALGWDEATARAWTRALAPLLKPSARGIWTRSARALYDLQKIPSDLEGEVYTVDPIEWLRSFGRRPLRRPLTHARTVILLGHLAAARRHLRRTRISTADRERLDALLAAEITRAEHHIRHELGPIIRGVLNEVGFRPTNLPERVAQDKVIDELLDRICERGFLRFGDLRDTIARNQLKMPDLRGLAEWLNGDALLRVDRRLAVELDGIYRRAELYLRVIQRGMSAAFGTPAGRWLAKYLALPFVGAFLVVEFAEYLSLELGKVYGFLHGLLPREPEDEGLFEDYFGESNLPAEAPAAHGVTLTPESLTVVVVLGFIFLGLLYWPAFRSAVWTGIKQVWKLIHFIIITLPLTAWRSPPVRAVRNSWFVAFLDRYFGAAFLLTLAVAAFLLLLGAGPRRTARWSAIVFALAVAFTNTPFGRRIGDDLGEAFADAWRIVRVNLIPGLIAWVLDVFQLLGNLVARGLYAVDEWFRFREGQTGGSLAAKVLLALIWFPIAYLVRFGFTLLLEPQINPLKHFPVVTVSHKLLLPLIGAVSDATGLSEATAGLIIAGIPGIFGFIAWELRENWRLYAANRPRRLPPVVLGHHGETMRGLLRPGFHSGTVPRLYRKLRSAVRRTDLTGRPVPLGKSIRGLHDVAHSVELFAGRELVSLLRAAESWRGLTPTVGAVRVFVQTIEISLAVPELGGPNLRLAFDYRDETIIARLAEPGWASRLSTAQADVLHTALAGLCVEACAEPLHAAPLTWSEWVAYWERTKHDANGT
jgi:hypothetical protein